MSHRPAEHSPHEPTPVCEQKPVEHQLRAEEGARECGHLSNAYAVTSEVVRDEIGEMTLG
jgi:hypothetical protein